jgi:RimJ/RimL family protein N-acetyltransferase
MPDEPTAIRVLTPDDAALFREIRLEGLQNHPDAFTSTYARESPRPLSFFADRLAYSTVFGAFRDGELIGVAGFARQPAAKHAHKATLWGMYVRPAARQTGLGERLIEAVLDYARTQVEQLQLVVVADNHPARRLYTRLGFKEYGYEKQATKYHGRYHDDVLMAKMLMPTTDAVGPSSGDVNP